MLKLFLSLFVIAFIAVMVVLKFLTEGTGPQALPTALIIAFASAGGLAVAFRPEKPRPWEGTESSAKKR